MKQSQSANAVHSTPETIRQDKSLDNTRPAGLQSGAQHAADNPSPAESQPVVNSIKSNTVSVGHVQINTPKDSSQSK